MLSNLICVVYMNEFIIIGQITKAMGIRGEVKVKPLTDDPNRYRKLKSVFIEDRPYRIERCRIDGNDAVYIKFLGVDTRNDAELLKDFFVKIDRVNAVDLDENTFFIADVIGCKLFTDDGAEIGKVTEVNQYGAADVFTASDGIKVVRFPFLKKMIVKVDVETGVIIVKKSVFDEVSVYEN